MLSGFFILKIAIINYIIIGEIAMSNKSALGDVFIAFNNANCKDLNLFRTVLDAMWNDKSLEMSQDWYENKLPKVIKDDASFIKNMDATIAGTNGFARYKKDFIDTKYINMITNTSKPTRKTKPASNVNTQQVTATVHHTAPGKISLRTVLTCFGNEQIFESAAVLPQIKKMEDDGVISSGSYDFISNGPGKTAPQFAATVKNCLEGKAWQSQPLQAFPDFSKYIPAKYRAAYVKNHSTTKNTNNVRTIIATLYKKDECKDALKIAGILADLKKAGFVNMDYNLIPGLVNMTESDLQKLGESAVKGTGLFKDQKIVKDKELLATL